MGNPEADQEKITKMKGGGGTRAPSPFEGSMRWPGKARIRRAGVPALRQARGPAATPAGPPLQLGLFSGPGVGRQDLLEARMRHNLVSCQRAADSF